ncbi:MAG TPA: hypothetical protein VFV50_18000 [Bdellovibrionales bacterium]|nr:hypothetical protein [Bdellovibrionales bacterium]
MTVQPHSNGEMWLVRYDIDEPVEGLLFLRQRNQFRSRTWTGMSGGAMVASSRGVEVIAGREPLRSFEFLVRPYFGETQKDYEFFVRFGDGGTVVYTGHMSAIPVNCAGDCRVNQPEGIGTYKITYNFIPRPGEHVLIDGAPSTAPVSWDEEGLGRFVYFGRQVPVSRAGFTYLGDARSPDWVAQEIERLALPLIQYYSSQTGYPLARAPLVFLSFDPYSSWGARGGVLPGQVQLSIGGSEWRARSPEHVNRFQRLLAHELAHLWNGDLFQNAGEDGQSWMHEGGAEAFALRALRDGGHLSETRYRDLHTEAINECTAGLSGVALVESDAFRRFQNYYTCGTVINLLAERMSAARAGSLFRLWGDIFRRASGGRYSSHTFFRAVEDAASVVQAGGQLRALVHERLPRPDKYTFDLLREYGIEVENRFESAPLWFVRSSNRRLVSELVRQNCGGQIEDAGEALAVSAPGECPYLRSGDRVVRLEYVAGLDDPNLYEIYVQSCTQRGQVSVQVEGRGPVALPCQAVLEKPVYAVWTGANE